MKIKTFPDEYKARIWDVQSTKAVYHMLILFKGSQNKGRTLYEKNFFHIY